MIAFIFKIIFYVPFTGMVSHDDICGDITSVKALMCSGRDWMSDILQYVDLMILRCGIIFNNTVYRLM